MPAYALALGALVLAAGVMAPTLWTLRSRLLGLEYVDGYGTQWFYWFTGRALGSGLPLGHSDLFFFPWGKDILAHTGANVLDAALAWPLRALLGPVAGYNCFIGLTMLLGGLCARGLASEVTQDKLAAWGAASLFTFSPYVLLELVEGRPTQAMLWPLLLAVWAAWRAASGPGWRAPVGLGVALAVCGYQYWFYALFGGLVAGGLALAQLIRGGQARLALFARFAGAAALSLLLCAPVALPLALRLGEPDGGVPGLLDVSAWTWNHSPPRSVEGLNVALLTFQPFRWQTGFYVLGPDGREELLPQVSALSGFTLALAAWGLWRRRELRLAVILGLIPLLLIAVGPVLALGELVLPNPSYVAFVKLLPPARRLWFPERALAGVVVLLVPACAAALEGLRSWAPSARGLVLAASGPVLLAELGMLGLAPLPSWDARVPAGYRCLAEGPPGAVIELPMDWSQAHLYYQTQHGRPIFGGMLELNSLFTPEGQQATLRDNSWLRALRAVIERTPQRMPEWRAGHRDALSELGYRYVVLIKDALPEAPSRWQHPGAKGADQRVLAGVAELAGLPVYEDARVAVYAPWDSKSPCEAVSPAPDTRRYGRTDVPVAERTLPPVPLRRLGADPPGPPPHKRR